MKFNNFFPAQTGDFTINHHSTDALAGLPYQLELELKNNAVSAMLKASGLKISPAPTVPSPLSRQYRTTSKRRVFFDRGKVILHFGRKPCKEAVAFSNLEPASHIEIYQYLQKKLSMPQNFKAASALNYCIIRGSYTEHALIFNTRMLSADIIRIFKAVSNDLPKHIPAVKSIFLYVDETASDYYLEAERPAKGISFKKMYGPEFLALKLDNKKFLYSPISFSQINESILTVFKNKFMEYLTPEANDILLDIYCGYGLWSLLYGSIFKNVWGTELSAESVKSAISNAKFHYPDKKFHYETAFVTAEALRAKMPPPRRSHEWILLDPPRQGCAPGVLEYLISRRPGKIFHMFCGADEIIPALEIYLANNCCIEAVIPFDFFPGTINIEALAVITPPEK